jgi:hypothetical protein
VAGLFTLLAATWSLPIYSEPITSYNPFLATHGLAALLRYFEVVAGAGCSRRAAAGCRYRQDCRGLFPRSGRSRAAFHEARLRRARGRAGQRSANVRCSS